MFKNIIPNSVKRLVFLAGPEVPKVAEKAIEKKVRPEALKAEARELSKSIDNYVADIEQDINVTRSEASKGYIKINLSDPKSYEKLDRDRWSVVESLSEAKKALQEGATRGNLDFVRVKLAAASAFYDSFKRVGDPLGASAKLEATPKAQPKKVSESTETREAHRWAFIADNAMRLAYLPDTPDNRQARANLQNELKDLAQQIMAGKDHMKKAGVTIDRAPGAGTPAFRITVERTTRLEQGGRPGAQNVKRVETVYAGGSKVDFPEKTS